MSGRRGAHTHRGGLPSRLRRRRRLHRTGTGAQPGLVIPGLDPGDQPPPEPPPPEPGDDFPPPEPHDDQPPPDGGDDGTQPDDGGPMLPHTEPPPEAPASRGTLIIGVLLAAIIVYMLSRGGDK